jgi:hypothetical protein
MLGIDHVANGDRRKFHVRLALAIGRRRGDAVAQRVHRDDEVLGGIDQLAGPDERNQVFGGSAKPSGEKDSIGFVCVQFASGAVSDAAVVDSGSTFQTEIAQAGEVKLLRETQRGVQGSNEKKWDPHAFQLFKSGPAPSISTD